MNKINWEEFKYSLHQINPEMKKRESKWVAVCNIKGGNLEMDHIKEWCNYPNLRYEISNCRTLCKACHKNTDNYGNKALKKKVT